MTDPEASDKPLAPLTPMPRFRKLPSFEPDGRPELPIGHYSWMEHTPDLDPDGFMDRRELLTCHQAFIDLIDRVPVFDYIVDIMGPNLLLGMTQAIVRHSGEDSHCYTHTDGGESLRTIRVTESSPPVAMKAMYLLTDVTEPDSGNLTVFPGSHMRLIPLPGERTMSPYSPGAAQLMGRAGDVYLFPHALWHGPSRNLSGHRRLEIGQGSGQARGQAVRQQTEGGVTLRAIPAGDPHAARRLAFVGAVTGQRATAMRMIGTTRKPCIAPRLGPNVLLAGVPRLKPKLHRPRPGGVLSRAGHSSKAQGTERVSAWRTTGKVDGEAVDLWTSPCGPARVLRTVWTGRAFDG